MEGAAICHLISQLVAAVLPVFYFIDRSNSSRLHLCKTSFYSKVLRDACINGSSELMTNLSMSLVNILYNYQLLRLAGENGVAAYGVIMYAAFLFVAVFVGYAWAVHPSSASTTVPVTTPRCTTSTGKACGSSRGGRNLDAGFHVHHPLCGAHFCGLRCGIAGPDQPGLPAVCAELPHHGFNVYASSFFTALGDGVTSALISFLRTLRFR